MDNQNHCMSIKQTRLIVDANKHNLQNSFCNNENAFQTLKLQSRQKRWQREERVYVCETQGRRGCGGAGGKGWVRGSRRRGLLGGVSLSGS